VNIRRLNPIILFDVAFLDYYWFSVRVLLPLGWEFTFHSTVWVQEYSVTKHGCKGRPLRVDASVQKKFGHRIGDLRFEIGHAAWLRFGVSSLHDSGEAAVRVFRIGPSTLLGRGVALRMLLFSYLCAVISCMSSVIRPGKAPWPLDHFIKKSSSFINQVEMNKNLIQS
jgi:hypothetical protein